MNRQHAVLQWAAHTTKHRRSCLPVPGKFEYRRHTEQARGTRMDRETPSTKTGAPQHQAPPSPQHGLSQTTFDLVTRRN